MSSLGHKAEGRHRDDGEAIPNRMVAGVLRQSASHESYTAAGYYGGIAY